jgi:hypothetical protein
MLIIARLTPANDTFQEYFCIPRRGLGSLKQITLRPATASGFDKYRQDDLTFLKKLARRSKAKRDATKG